MKMASKKSQVEYYDINEIKEKEKTPEAIFCGVCSAEKWKSGKKVSEDEYKKAVERFLTNPIGRRII